VAGNPARLIRYRFEASVIHKLQAIAWWNFRMSVLRRLAEFLMMSKSLESRAFAAI
jgi:virginiamycin A acetyltransferase